MDRSRFLPDSRLMDRRQFINRGLAGTWVPVFCANCGKSGGEVPEENMTFFFYLCNACTEVYGAIANTLMVPDEQFYTEIAAEQAARQQKEGG